MEQLGYDGKEMFKKGRFRPATFWKTEKCKLAAPPVHKDRALLTAFRLLHSKEEQERNWYILNCHLQAGKEGKRRVRQINEGVRAVMTLAKKLKGTLSLLNLVRSIFSSRFSLGAFTEANPPRHARLIVCGDFNGGPECGAVRYLEDGYIDETFIEDGDPVSSGRKDMPLEKPLKDVMTFIGRPPPPTLVVPELISVMVKGNVYENPQLSDDIIDRLTRIYNRFASHETASGTKVMNLQDVEKWLITINRKLGRGSEYREAARQMGWKEETARVEDGKARIELPAHGLLSLEGFVNVYQAELRQGKFWGIAYDMAALEEPLPNAGVFQSRYDRIYCSEAVEPTAVMDFLCSEPCPNGKEPSDHLPVAASFTSK